MKKIVFAAFFCLTITGLTASQVYHPDRFLFNLDPASKAISKIDCKSMITPYVEINQFMKKHKAVRLEPWLPNAKPQDHDGNVYLSKIYRIVLAPGKNSIDEIIDEFKGISRHIQSAEREPVLKKCYDTDDPRLSQQWYMNRTGVKAAWDLWDIEGGELPGSREIVLACVDDGVDYLHEDLQTQIWVNQDELGTYAGLADTDLDGFVTVSELINLVGDINGDGSANLYDVIFSTSFLTDNNDNDNDGYIDNIIGWDTNESTSDSDDDNNPMVTDNSHGTHVAGLLGAATNNGKGIASAGFNIKIMPVKATGDEATLSISTGYNGLLYAAKSGADIINLSWGGTGYSSYAQNLINICYDTYGAIIVAAAGNGDDDGNPSDEFHYPSGFNHVVSVTAVSSSDIFSWANYGAANLSENFYGVDIAAPGENMMSTFPRKLGNYASQFGTSMASPFTASCFALVKSVYPDSSREWITDRILTHSDPIDSLNPDYAGQLGSGRINVLKALVFDKWPSIDYVSNYYMIESGDSDTLLNPGESINLMVELENLQGWAAAEDVHAVLRTDVDEITISDSIGTWPDIVSEDRRFNALDVFTVEFGEDILTGSYDFILDITTNQADGFPYSRQLDFQIKVVLDQQGFPLPTTDAIEISPMLADMNGNDTLDIIYGDKSGNVYVCDATGRLFSDFPVSLGSSISGISLANVNGDSLPEIISTVFDNRIYAHDAGGNKIWTRNIPGFITAIPAVGQLDDDPEPEIVFGAFDGKIHALNHDSTYVPGYPFSAGQNVKGGVALADLDNDGEDEIVYVNMAQQLNVMDTSGQSMEGWPQQAGSVSSGPFVINNGPTGSLILVGTDAGDILCFRKDGTKLFSIDGAGAIKSSPVVLVRDEIIYAAYGTTSGNIYLINVNSGNIEENWPRNISQISGSLASADIDNDGNSDILAVDRSGKIYAFDPAATLISGFPIELRHLSSSGLALADLDLDGDTEIIAGQDNGLSVADHKERSVNIVWPLRRGDYSNRGSIDLGYTRSDPAGLPNDLQFRLIGNSPNPFNAKTVIKYQVSESFPVRLKVYSIDGRQVFNETDYSPDPGMNEIRLDFSGLSSGIYVYTLKQKDLHLNSKMIYLK